MQVAIKSLFLNNTGEEIDLHIVTDGFPPKIHKQINALADHFGRKIEIHTVDASRFSSLPEITESASPIPRGTYLRLLLPELLSGINKILYLDTDIIVDRPIRELWDTPLDGNYYAASTGALPEHKKRLGFSNDEPYINAGVMLMNLPAFRRDEICSKCIRWIQDNPDKASLIDQDALNAVCRGKFIETGPEFNVHRRLRGDYSHAEENAVKHPVIYHFTAFKPWFKHTPDPIPAEFRELWEHYRDEAPKTAVRVRRHRKRALKRFLKQGPLTRPLYRIWVKFRVKFKI